MATAETIALSRALRSARASAGLSQVLAAKKIGVHPVTLYVWETEKRADTPSSANLARAARVYGTTPSVLSGSAPTATIAPRVARKQPKGAVKRGRPPATAMPRAVFGRVFRLLADLADNSELTLAELGAAQRAMTDPTLVDVFAKIMAGR